MNRLNILAMRIVLGAVFAVIMSRFFFPRASLIYAAGLGIFLVAMAYLFESLHNARSKREDKP